MHEKQQGLQSLIKRLRYPQYHSSNQSLHPRDNNSLFQSRETNSSPRSRDNSWRLSLETRADVSVRRQQLTSQSGENSWRPSPETTTDGPNPETTTDGPDPETTTVGPSPKTTTAGPSQDNPMPESTLNPQSGTKNSATYVLWNGT
jgi:hypothetical protein